MSTERCVETTIMTLALDPGEDNGGAYPSYAGDGTLNVRVYWDATPNGDDYDISNVSLEIGASTGLLWRRAPDYIHDLLVTDKLHEWCLQKTLADDFERAKNVQEQDLEDARTGS